MYSFTNFTIFLLLLYLFFCFFYFRVLCAVLVLSCLAGTVYDGIQRLQNNPYSNLKEDNQENEVLQNEHAKEEDKVETMRIDYSTKRKLAKLGIFFNFSTIWWIFPYYY